MLSTPRTFQRSYPDANQVGVGSLVDINQSTITFTGEPGLVFALWVTRLRNGGAVAIQQNEARIITTETLVIGQSGGMWFDATANRQASLISFGCWLNPRAGGTAKIQTFISAGSVTCNVNDGSVLILTWPFKFAEGPLVTVA